MNINLNLDSFRAMVGANNYGEVRLNLKDGGLEKINQHFLQRHNIGRIEVDKEENNIIRDAFLQSIAGKVDSDTYRQIRSRLGITSLLKTSRDNHDTDVYNSSLSRREIKAILDIVDRKAFVDAKLSENAGVSAIRDGGATFLSSILDIYNNKHPNEQVHATKDQLKVIFNRHGLELQLAAGKAVNAKESGMAETVAGLIRRYLSDETLVESCALSGSQCKRSNSEKTRLSNFKFDSFRTTMMSLGLKHQKIQEVNGQDRTKLHFGKDDFEPFCWTTFALTNEAKCARFTELKEKCGNDSINKGEHKELVELIEEEIFSWATYNMGRNPLHITIGDKAFDELETWQHLGDDKKNERDLKASSNEKNLHDILAEIRQLKKDMTCDQYIALTRILNQSAYNLPSSFGSKPGHYNDVRATVSVDDKGPHVSFKWDKPKMENVLPMELKYDVDERGMVHVTSAGVCIDQN